MSDDVKYWGDPDLLDKFCAGLSGPLQELLDESVRAAVTDYLKDGLFSFLSGSGVDLQVLFLPAEGLDDLEHRVPLIEILETELESNIPTEFYSAPLTYAPDGEDEEIARVRLLQAMIRAYYDNGGPDLKPYK